jgi:hypothetical protein
MEFYSAIKNKIMSFSGKWIEPDMVSDVEGGKKDKRG